MTNHHQNLQEPVIQSVIYMYIYIYRERERERCFWHHILAISRDVCRNGSQMFIEIYRVGDNRRTVNTSATPHICDQLGTENTCKTLFCLFIVMIWVLVCNNMYRYQHHFGLLYRNPTILRDGFDVASKWVNTGEFLFLLKYNDRE